MSRERIIVVGNGYIGSYLARRLREKHPVIVVGTVTNESVVAFNDLDDVAREFRPTVFVYAVKLGSLADYEQNQTLIGESMLYCAGVRALASHCGSYFVNLSSSYVFDEMKPFRTENEPTYPISWFGRSMVANEWMLMTSDVSVTLRLCGVYGDGKSTKRSNWDLWAIDRWRNGETVHGFDRCWTTPTFIGDVFQAVELAIADRLTGIYHVAGMERIRRHAFFIRLADFLGIDTDLAVSSPVQVGYRPQETSLDSSKIQRAGVTFCDLEDGFRQSRY